MNFYEINAKSEIYENLKTYCSDYDWIEQYNFLTKILPDELIQKDKFLSWLYDRYKFQLGILKMYPNTFYNWHLDAKRGCTINMLISYGIDSHSIFFNKKQNEECYFINELKYKPQVYYLLNTQTYHSVLNLNNIRFVMTTEFVQDKHSLSFAKIKDDIFLNWKE